ncbi:MAG: formimidoylglutamate deiminase [Paracoccaceae bacterium]
MSDVTRIEARHALLPDGWARDVRITLEGGRIAAVDRATPLGPGARGVLIPAPVNAHSHAFQRAMAGLTERRGPDPADSFWTWRRTMYRFLDRLTPDDVEAIAAFVQMEMAEAGFGASVEFHYLHHASGGVPYADPAEMSARICAAARTSGIGLTLLPVLYRWGGCDGRPLGPGQDRFGCDLDLFARLHDGARAAVAALPADARIGVAPHSLRACAPGDLSALLAAHPTGPVHMHLAEQPAEVAEVEAHLGARPIEWALDNLGPDERWCLIHCTQSQPHETSALAGTGAVAGLCPITESSLGDGIFDGVRWLDAGGALALGSDSDIRVSLTEEMRTLEHSQRLRDGTRAALATADRSTARRLLDAVCAGGARAAGRACGAIAPGLWADLTALDDRHLTLDGLGGDTLLDAWTFAGTGAEVTDVWSAGRHLVRERRHVERDAIAARYRAVQARLRAAA